MPSGANEGEWRRRVVVMPTGPRQYREHYQRTGCLQEIAKGHWGHEEVANIIRL